MIIDVHNHFYPEAFIDELRNGRSELKVKNDKNGNPVLYSPGDVNVAVPGHRLITYREKVLKQEKIDHQLLSLTCPGTLLETPERSAKLSRLVNDEFAKIVESRSKLFSALATLPLNDPKVAVVEFDRITKLGFPGCMLMSNVNGVPLADKRFWPLYERADITGAVMYIHPTFPVGAEAMKEYWLVPLVGFLFDTTLAAAHLVFAGVPEKFPNIKWVLGHLGGTIPYVAERLDRGYDAFPECRVNIPKPPSEYFKRFYYDTVNFDPKALRLAIAFAGINQILAGSDYPHQIGSIYQMKATIEKVDMRDGDRAKILCENAARLLGMSI